MGERAIKGLSKTIGRARVGPVKNKGKVVQRMMPEAEEKTVSAGMKGRNKEKTPGGGNQFDSRRDCCGAWGIPDKARCAETARGRSERSNTAR